MKHMTFYKILSALVITLLVFSSNVYSMESTDELLFPEESTDSSTPILTKVRIKALEFDNPLDKYEKAILLCGDSSSSNRCSCHYSGSCPDRYENAMKICGADNYRRYPITIWGIDISNSIYSYNYESLISA